MIAGTWTTACGTRKVTKHVCGTRESLRVRERLAQILFD